MIKFHTINVTVIFNTLLWIKYNMVYIYFHILLTRYNKQQPNILHISSSCQHYQISYRMHKQSGEIVSIFAKYRHNASLPKIVTAVLGCLINISYCCGRIV